MSSHALAAVLCGIGRDTARRAAKKILERGAVIELECRPGPGRKRRCVSADDSPSDSHEYNLALCKVSLPFDSCSKLSGEKKPKELPDDV